MARRPDEYGKTTLGRPHLEPVRALLQIKRLRTQASPSPRTAETLITSTAVRGPPQPGALVFWDVDTHEPVGDRLPASPVRRALAVSDEGAPGRGGPGGVLLWDLAAEGRPRRCFPVRSS